MNHFQCKGSELYRALKPGVDPRKVVCSGVGKKDDGIEKGERIASLL